jgi:hypothetical protein
MAALERHLILVSTGELVNQKISPNRPYSLLRYVGTMWLALPSMLWMNRYPGCCARVRCLGGILGIDAAGTAAHPDWHPAPSKP